MRFLRSENGVVLRKKQYRSPILRFNGEKDRGQSTYQQNKNAVDQSVYGMFDLNIATHGAGTHGAATHNSRPRCLPADGEKDTETYL